MPLTSCPECKREISDLALACPHCGFLLGENTLEEEPIVEQVESETSSTAEKKKKDSVSTPFVIIVIGIALLFSIFSTYAVRDSSDDNSGSGTITKAKRTINKDKKEKRMDDSKIEIVASEFVKNNPDCEKKDDMLKENTIICFHDTTFQYNTKAIARSQNISVEDYVKNWAYQKLLFGPKILNFVENNSLESAAVVMYVKTQEIDKYGNKRNAGEKEIFYVKVTKEILRKVNFEYSEKLASSGDVREFVKWAEEVVQE